MIKWEGVEAQSNTNMEVCFEASGYSRSARRHGPPEQWVAAEERDEREITELRLFGRKVPKVLADGLIAEFSAEMIDQVHCKDISRLIDADITGAADYEADMKLDARRER